MFLSPYLRHLVAAFFFSRLYIVARLKITDASAVEIIVQDVGILVIMPAFYQWPHFGGAFSPSFC